MSRLRRPLVAALLCYLAGLLLALRFPLLAPPLPATLIVAGVTSLAVIHGRKPALHRLLPFVLIALAGGFSGAARVHDLERDCRLVLQTAEPRNLEALLLAPHRPGGPFAPLLPASIVRLEDGVRCSGKLRIRMPAGLAEIPAGSTVRISARWVDFDRPPTVWPSDPYGAGFLRADSATVLDAPIPALLRARGGVDTSIDLLFPAHRPAIEALLLGRREYLDRSLRDRFAAAGLAHLLAISGMHVGLLATLLLLTGSILRVPREHRDWATIGGIWLYLAMIGAPASALRAGMMLTFGLVGRLIQRPYAPEAGIAAAALLLLVAEPLSILDPGFQLSFAGVLGILLLRDPVAATLPPLERERRAFRHFRDAIVVSCAAFAATAPIALHHFGQLAPIAIVAGLPAVPLMSLAMAGVFLSVALQPLFPAGASLIADGAARLLDLLVLLADRAAAVPFGHFTAAAPPIGLWIDGFLVLFFFHRLLARSRPAVRRALVLCGTGAALIAIPSFSLPPADQLAIHFIDVGQGDATAIRTPHGHWILVDAGPADDRFDAGSERVVPFLRMHGARELQALMITHPDLDHIGGAPAVIAALPTRHIFDPGVAFGRRPYLALIDRARDGRIDWRAARAGRTIELDGVLFEILAPDPKIIDAKADANQISAVVRVRFGDFVLLLTGDAEAASEQDLVTRYGTGLRADVLKLGHHGSATSSTPAFLDAVSPRLAVVSAGRRNRYGHPAAAVMRRVEQRGIGIARTDTEGNVTVIVTEQGRTWRREGW